MNIENTCNQNKIKYIFADNNNWEVFKDNHLSEKVPSDMVSNVIEEVEKFLKCGEYENGYTLYKCPDCNEKHIVAFSCKSRFCPRCGKKYIDEWVNKQVDNILDTSHRHMVFTIPEELRKYVYWNRDLIKEMSNKVAEVIKSYYRKQNKRLKYEAGIITVVHTFGRDVGFNPHIHCLVTEGALDKYKQWKHQSYISYNYLRKAWQKVLLDIFKGYFSENKKVQNLINKLYARYKDGFYVYANSRMRKADSAARYIGRYLARPAIAEYRIISYDGEKVKFWYEDHKTKKIKELTLPVMQFIGRLIMHIPKKYFRMVRRYGLYRRDFNKRAQKILALWSYMRKRQINLILVKKKARSKTWRERIIENFNIDPVKCPKCGKEMILWEVWNPKYDFIYHVEHTDEKGRHIRRYLWEGDPRLERIQKARDNGTSVPFPYGKREVV
ncbi:IS91 family transposase [Orenia marismortui]|uniref:Transposase-like zinc-binding protein n=1 Tax=Orenia marismortui TaxID=46469 RepID=A0A4V3GW63_9FIRM|nr:IS91 family transposase [Orenia marismortui]TDX42889.1 transposase-like zinc-binding protein [Orenia marismortui]